MKLRPSPVGRTDDDYHHHVRYCPIDGLKPLGRRTREHSSEQVAALALSIQTFGFCEPVIIDAEGHVIVGYGRILAAKGLGWTEVPTLTVSHLSAAQMRAYMIASNRIAELAGWNKEFLALEFKDLARMDLDFSLDATGFTIEEREALTFGVNLPEEREDDLPAGTAEVVSCLGDLWACGDHRVLCGDALAPESYAILTEGEPVQAVLTDPPYNVPTQGHITSNRAHGDFVQAAGEMSEAEFAAFLLAVMTRLFEVLAPGGLVYAFMDWRSIANLVGATKTAGLVLLNLIVWAKTQAGQGSFYRSQHELIVQALKPGAAHRNNIQLGRNGRHRSNVWTYAGVGGFGAAKARERALHPTVKPVALLRDALLDCTLPGELVCDSFSGSGGVVLACESTGRRARVMDLDPRYVDVTVTRWEGYTGRQAIHAETGLTFAETARARLAAAARPPVRIRRRGA